MSTWEEPPLFDPDDFDPRKPWQGKKEPTPFEKGMAGSELAGRKWTDKEKTLVDEAIEIVASNHAEFTADEVWRCLDGAVPVTKGMASRLNMAARRGVIESTGRTTVARRGGDHDHAQRLNIWRSMA